MKLATATATATVTATPASASASRSAAGGERISTNSRRKLFGQYAGKGSLRLIAFDLIGEMPNSTISTVTSIDNVLFIFGC